MANMPSSAYQPTSRTLSNHNNRIQRTQEVSVTSLPGNARPGIGVHGTYPTNSLHNARSQSESAVRSPSSYSPNPNVTQPRSRSSMAVSMGQLHLLKNQATEDRRKESQSIKDLAEFLKTKEPPPNNWMSVPEPVERGRSTKRPLWLFHRKSSKNPAGQDRHIRLPDSAVAAKTLGGHWHIAITIPNEHYPNHEQPEPERQHEFDGAGGGQRQVVHNRKGTSTITVLKPVTEEKPLSFRESPKAVFKESDFGPEKDLEAYNGPRAATGALRPRVQNRQQRNYVIVNPQEDHEHINYDRRHSGGTIYSVKSLEEGLNHSHAHNVSMTDSTGLGEDKNGIRRVPLRGIDAPSRHSSIQQQLLTPESAADASRISYPSTYIKGHQHSLSALSNSQSVAQSVDSNLSMGRISIAETAVLTDSSKKNRRSATQSQSGPPPDRKLPNLPESSGDDARTIRPLSLPSVATPTTKEKSAQAAEQTWPISQPSPENKKSKDPGREKNRTSVESRRELVKALRNRDMAAQIGKVKRNSDSSQASAEAATTILKAAELEDSNVSSKPVPGPDSTPSKRTTRRVGSISPRRRTSFERKRGRNCLSSIMVVATIPPRYEYGVPRCVGSLTGSLAASAKSKARSGLGGAPTPPRSQAPSVTTSSDEREDEDFKSPNPTTSSRRNLARANSISSSQTHKRVTSTASAPQASSTRKFTPPQKLSRSVNHSPKTSEDLTAVSARTADLEMRLAKVERSNKVMIQTVSAVLAMGKGLGELGDLLPQLTGEPDILKDLGMGLKKAKSIREELGNEASETDTVTNIPIPMRKGNGGSVAHAKHEMPKMPRPAAQRGQTEREQARKISQKAGNVEAVLKRLGMELPSSLKGTQQEKRRNESLREVEDLMRELRGASRLSLEGERSLSDSHDSL